MLYEVITTTRYSVRFLDNVITKTPYHFEQNEQNQKKERRVGLGTMGLAELMIKLHIRYGSPESLEFLDKLYGFIAKDVITSYSIHYTKLYELEKIKNHTTN